MVDILAKIAKSKLSALPLVKFALKFAEHIVNCYRSNSFGNLYFVCPS